MHEKLLHTYHACYIDLRLHACMYVCVVRMSIRVIWNLVAGVSIFVYT